MAPKKFEERVDKTPNLKKKPIVGGNPAREDNNRPTKYKGLLSVELPITERSDTYVSGNTPKDVVASGVGVVCPITPKNQKRNAQVIRYCKK